MRIVDQIVHQRRHIFHRQRLQLIGTQTEDGQGGDAGEHAAIERVQMIVAQIQDAQIVQAIEGAFGQKLCVCVNANQLISYKTLVMRHVL